MKIQSDRRKYERRAAIWFVVLLVVAFMMLWSTLVSVTALVVSTVVLISVFVGFAYNLIQWGRS